MHGLRRQPDSIMALDLDGTLVDPRPRQIATLNEAARELGLSCPDGQEVWQYKRTGLSTRDALRMLHVPEAEARALADRWAERIEDDDLLSLDVAFPSAAAALELARTAGARPVVLTARRRASAVRPQVWRLFGELIGEVVVARPDAVIVEKASVLRALQPIGYVGDTEVDAYAAERAGVPFAGVGSGQRDPSWLKARTRASVYQGVVDAVDALLASKKRREQGPRRVAAHRSWPS